MSTVPEFLRHDLVVGAPATVVLRSGVQLHGSLEAVDLVDDLVRIGGWAVRVEEIAGVRAGLVGTVESAPTDTRHSPVSAAAPQGSTLSPPTAPTAAASSSGAARSSAA